VRERVERGLGPVGADGEGVDFVAVHGGAGDAAGVRGEGEVQDDGIGFTEM